LSRSRTCDPNCTTSPSACVFPAPTPCFFPSPVKPPPLPPNFSSLLLGHRSTLAPRFLESRFTWLFPLQEFLKCRVISVFSFAYLPCPVPPNRDLYQRGFFFFFCSKRRPFDISTVSCPGPNSPPLFFFLNGLRDDIPLFSLGLNLLPPLSPTASMSPTPPWHYLFLLDCWFLDTRYSSFINVKPLFPPPVHRFHVTPSPFPNLFACDVPRGALWSICFFSPEPASDLFSFRMGVAAFGFPSALFCCRVFFSPLRNRVLGVCQVWKNVESSSPSGPLSLMKESCPFNTNFFSHPTLALLFRFPFPRPEVCLLWLFLELRFFLSSCCSEKLSLPQHF